LLGIYRFGRDGGVSAKTGVAFAAMMAFLI